MGLKTIFIILVTALLTVFFMQNAEPVQVSFLFSKVEISKLALLPGLALTGFLVGYITGRSGRKRASRSREILMPPVDSGTQPNSSIQPENRQPGTLSQEDQDYIR